MLYNGVDLHNVVEIEARSGFHGVQLHRMPKAVRDTLSQRGRWNSQYTIGSEIRFVTPSEKFRLFLSTLEGDADVILYRGDYQHGAPHHISPGVVACISAETPDFFRGTPSRLDSPRFTGNVWRVMLPALFTMFHQLETFGHPIRPPRPDEVPNCCMLSYGSSITMGTGSSKTYLGYPQIAARRLGIDVLNMGQGGACMCEPELADFFANRGGWDFAVFEIGVNMFAQYQPDEFRRRGDYLVRTVADANPDKPIFLVTPFINMRDILPERYPADDLVRWKVYCEIVRELGTIAPNVSVIDGHEILRDSEGLTTDLIHPSDHGNIQMGGNLANILRKKLAGKITIGRSINEK